MLERRQSSEFYFSPDSKLWEIDRERALLLFGGQRALLMQLAHPLVCEGVSEHSNFKEDPLSRLKHTRIAMSTLMFGTKDEVLDTARRINNAHKPVNGTLKHENGVYKAGAKYDAKNPDLTLWVWATLTDTRLVVYEKFVRPLAHNEKEQFYKESKELLPLLGGNPQETPSSVEDFSLYMKDMVDMGNVIVGQKARDLAPYIMLKQLPRLNPLSFISLISIGLLPEKIRDQYGFSWNPLKQTFLDTTSAASRRIFPHIPDSLRFSSGYRNARKKMNS